MCILNMIGKYLSDKYHDKYRKSRKCMYSPPTSLCALIVTRRKHVVTMAPGGRSSKGRSAAGVQGTAQIVTRRKHVVTMASGGRNTKGRSAAGVQGTALIVARRKHVVTMAPGGRNTKGRSRNQP